MDEFDDKVDGLIDRLKGQMPKEKEDSDEDGEGEAETKESYSARASDN